MMKIYFKYFIGMAYLFIGIESYKHVFALFVINHQVLGIINLLIALFGIPYGCYNIIDGIIAHKKYKD